MSLGKILVALYSGFKKRRWLLFILLSLLTVSMAITSLNIRFTEDPLQLFPTEGESAGSAKAFSRLKAKDKIIALIKFRDTSAFISPDFLADAADSLNLEIIPLIERGAIEPMQKSAYEGESEFINYIYNNLPLFLEESDYKRIDDNIESERVLEKLQNSLAIINSPAGTAVSGMISRDPLSLGTHLIAKLDSLRMGVSYNNYRDYIFSENWYSLFFIITPSAESSDSGNNDYLVSQLEAAEIKIEAEFPELDVMLSGAPFASVYNARIIKRDTLATSLIALIIIGLLFWISFRNPGTLAILIAPALFGALFAISIMALRGEPVSAIAIGAGATVMGIALSYSIHVISHLKHVKTIEQLIDELAYPLTVGGFTTIGAFVGLLFTNSVLLQDFGLFSALTLTGTTLFSLIFLPHFIKVNNEERETRLYRAIVKITSFKYEKVIWLRWLIAAMAVAGIFLASGVKFDSDFSNLGYEPESLSKAQKSFSVDFGGGDARVFLLSSSGSLKNAAESYYIDNLILDSLRNSGQSLRSASLSWLLPPESIQTERIGRWNKFWDDGKAQRLKTDLVQNGEEIGFSSDAFDSFISILEKEYTPVDYSGGIESLPHFFKEWAEERDGLYTFLTQLHSEDVQKEKLYEELLEETSFGILDRAHFSSVWAITIKEDFNIILLISSLLVFLTLLISYGRVELALMAFLPMAVSWVIILGLMNVFSIEFNIFNILLATFIFGIGDDFSIFVLDGLSAEYQGREGALESHKSAIFFSTFTVLAGVGSMAFATHPALRSIALVSIVGISAVWLVAYTIQPLVYRFFITSPASRGLHPYTFSGVLQMLLTFSAFATGCLFAAAFIPILTLLPVNHSKRVLLFRKILRVLVFFPVKLSPTVRIFRENPFNEDFNRPAVIVANHQSFIDILMLLSLHPKIIMMTNKWVWNSPVFGHIVRFAGFLYHKDGVENHIEYIKPKISEGYSLLVFPEGTRSADMEIHRFHKGAFKIAEELSLDIIPIIIYGNGNLVSKRQPFYVKRGVIGYKILERISYQDVRFGLDYRERSKSVVALMRKEYRDLRSVNDAPSNLFFMQKIMSGYIYKGPVTEWYLRIKMRMENYYKPFHTIIPAEAVVTDIGCGYGPLCFMLGLLSPDRVVNGIDYDSEKIEMAKSSWISGGNINFTCADALTCNLPLSDVIVINDVLHYLLPEQQESLIIRSVNSLKPGGFIILRDGDSERERDHRITKLTEWFSIKILKFNKASHSPCFTSGSKIREISSRLNCVVVETRNDNLTSNTIFTIRPKNASYE